MQKNNQDKDDKKVVPLEKGIDEYEAKPGDIPITELSKVKNPQDATVLKTGESHKLILNELNLSVVDTSNKPFADQYYTLTLSDSTIIQGQTDSRGLIKEKISVEGDIVLEFENGASFTVY